MVVTADNKVEQRILRIDRAIGSDWLVLDGLKAGDKVIFGKYSGQTVKVDGEELLVMREEDVMGIVE